MESVVLIDRLGNQAFTGDFVYQQSGRHHCLCAGIRSYGLQGKQQVVATHQRQHAVLWRARHPTLRSQLADADGQELGKIVKGIPDYRYVAHYLVPGIPWRVQQNGDMYIYTTPLVDPPLFWSKWTLLVLAVVSALALYLLYRIVRLPFVPARQVRSRTNRSFLRHSATPVTSFARVFAIGEENRRSDRVIRKAQVEDAAEASFFRAEETGKAKPDSFVTAGTHNGTVNHDRVIVLSRMKFQHHLAPHRNALARR